MHIGIANTWGKSINCEQLLTVRFHPSTLWNIQQNLFNLMKMRVNIFHFLNNIFTGNHHPTPSSFGAGHWGGGTWDWLSSGFSFNLPTLIYNGTKILRQASWYMSNR